MELKNKFLAFKDDRIKLSNIKAYGILNDSQNYLDEVSKLDLTIEKKKKEVNVLKEKSEKSIKTYKSRENFETSYYEENNEKLIMLLDQKNKMLETKEFQLAWKGELSYLYVTTFQDDNYEYYSHDCGFNIWEKLVEIDSYLL